MDSFDLDVLHFINSFAARSRLADVVIGHLSSSLLFNGGFIMALFWWAWMREDRKRTEHREILIFGLVASVFALFVARFIALVVPFRARPFTNPMAGSRIPYEMNTSALINWSSFPSDHATLFFCLAVTLWLVSRRLGLIALCHAVFIVCLPRIYAGVHYPTDILAGAALGCGIALLADVERLRSRIAVPLLNWSRLYPAVFYSALFLWTFEIGEMFDTLRGFLHPTLQIAEAAWHTLHTLA